MAKHFQNLVDLVGQPKLITELCESESDRGAILILAAYLEEILAITIAASCVSDDAANDILEFRGPAGGFDLKVRLCFALGLIHEEERKGLDAIRKIRNAAAHFDRKDGFNVLFDSERTKVLVHNLAATQKLGSKAEDPSSTKDLFFISVRLLATKLYARGLEVTRPEPPKTIKEKANEFRKLLEGTERGEAIANMEEEARKGNLEPFIESMAEFKQKLSEYISKAEE